MIKKVLAYGPIDEAEELFPGADIYQDNPPEEGKYDAIYLQNMLQQMRRKAVPIGLAMFFKALKPGGTIHIIVPSLEWACRQIAAKDDPSRLAYPTLYGTDEDLHLSGFTLKWLRAECELAGFKTQEAYSQEYTVEVNEEKVVGRGNIYIGMRPVEEAEEVAA